MLRRLAAASVLSALPVLNLSCPPAGSEGGIALPLPVQPHPGVALDVAEVSEGLDRPVFLCSAPGDANRLYIVEQSGVIQVVEGGEVRETPFLDLSETVGSNQGEMGLLGMAFHPDYADNGRFYVHYTNDDNNSTFASYLRSEEPGVADPDSGTVLLTVEQPFHNHKGGMLAFGPDGYLYIGLGDGGGANDPENNAQNRGNLLGKILRIDVDRLAPYAIPEDNPFVGVEGVRPEIWAYGLRNPWRFSFDRQTGDLWIGDVGQNALEEVNFQPAASDGGENYGWRVREGDICRPGEDNCDLPGAVEPLLSYFRVGPQSVTGGYVYRGAAIPALQGTYLFADFAGASVYSLTRSGGQVRVLNETDNLDGGAFTFSSIASLGEDGQGELYVLEYGAGRVWKIVPAA